MRSDDIAKDEIITKQVFHGILIATENPFCEIGPTDFRQEPFHHDFSFVIQIK